MATSRDNKTIFDFKSRLVGGGARPNLFEVELASIPGNIPWNADTFRFLCKGAALPAQNVSSIDVPFRGRVFKVAGDRTVDPWSVTIINDEGFELRNAFEQWANLMANLDTNIGATDPAAYMTDATVYQLGRGSKVGSVDNAGASNVVLKEYKFQSIFPTNVSEIALSYDSSDTIEEFTVEFQVQSFTFNQAGGSNG